MGHIRKINGTYYIEFYARGLLYSQAVGSDLKQAQELLKQVEGKIASGEALTMTRHIDLPDFFERFLSQAKGQWEPKSFGRFADTIGHFASFLNSDFPQVRQLAQLTPAIMESYKLHLARTQKVKIANLTMLLMKDILEFGIKLGFLNDNPCLHVRLLLWPATPQRKQTARKTKAEQLLPKAVSLSKIAQLLKLQDIARVIYFADLIPLSREDIYN